MRKLSSINTIGLLIGITFAGGIWLTAFYSGSRLLAWVTVLVLSYAIWLSVQSHAKDTRKLLIHGFIFGSAVVLIARLVLLLSTRIITDSWTTSINEDYLITDSLVEMFRIMLNGTVLQSIAMILLGGLIGLLAAFAGRALSVPTAFSRAFLLRGMLLITGVVMVTSVLSVVFSSRNTQDTIENFLGTVTDESVVVAERPERGEFDLSTVTFEELEQLNAEYDQETQALRNYDLEAALAAQIETADTPDSAPLDTGDLAYDQYIVKSGDTYACIAEEVYGDYRLWPEIVAINTGVGYRERRLYVGNIVELPDLPLAETPTTICN